MPGGSVNMSCKQKHSATVGSTSRNIHSALRNAVRNVTLIKLHLSRLNPRPLEEQYDWICLETNPVQFSSVTQLCPTLCDPMKRSTPGLPVHHPLPEFTQTHVHRVSDAIQPSHPLSSLSPPAPNPSQHQSLFQ